MDACVYDRGSGGESDHQPYKARLDFDGRDLFGRDDPRGAGRFSDRFRSAQNFLKRIRFLRNRDAPYDRPFRDPAFVAKRKVFKNGEDPLDRGRDPDRAFCDRDPDVHGVVPGTVLETSGGRLNRLF